MTVSLHTFRETYSQKSKCEDSFDQSIFLFRVCQSQAMLSAYVQEKLTNVAHSPDEVGVEHRIDRSVLTSTAQQALRR
jgi:hypothetical protein